MRAFREPLLHFMLIGTLLFGAHRLVAGDEREIVVTNAVRADVARRFRDETGRPPTAAEERGRLEQWKREEALFREAQRDGLDRGDPGVRRLLIDKVRARAQHEVPEREPTARELEDWLSKNRSLYEAPLRFAIEWLAFDGPRAAVERERSRAELEAGSEPRKLGAPLFGASLTLEQLRARLGDGVAAQAQKWRPGRWETAEGAGGLLLVRVARVAGGLPPHDELEPRLRVDWSAARRTAEAERRLDEVARRYRFEEAR